MDRSEREREVGAIRFFAERARDCVGRKLFKLLYLADVTHFKQTGEPITGLDYVSRKSVPLPYELKFELEAPQADLRDLVEIYPFKEGDADRHRFLPRAGTALDVECFTRREIQILQEVSSRFGGAAWENIEVSDFDNGAWKATPLGRPIDMVLSLPRDDSHYEDLVQSAGEYRARRAALHHFA